MPTHDQTSIRSGLWLSLRVLTVNLVVALVIVAALVLIVAGAAHAAGACPNEQLRAEDHSTTLPDCRSYELVSPAFKFGQPAGAGDVVAAASGERVAFESLGSFDEPESAAATNGGTYVARRSSAGWSVTAVNPPGSEFYPGTPFLGDVPYNVAGDTLDFSSQPGSELETSLFSAAPRSSTPGDFRFYVREAEGSKAFGEVGPILAPSIVGSQTGGERQERSDVQGLYEGATPDLSRVFFGIRPRPSAAFLSYWPGDPTVFQESLYEYSGAGSSEPRLVAVAPGPRERESRPAQDPALVSQCGSTIGGGTGGSSSSLLGGYNAVSSQPAAEEGRVVFFTAIEMSATCEASGGTVAPPVDELFARVNGTETVAISEPSKADCAACDISEIENPGLSEGERQQLGALFQGASSDGSKVYFLSKQRLLPGAENTNLYEYDFHAPSGEKIKLVASNLATDPEVSYPKLAGVMRVSEDGSRVYFVKEDHSLYVYDSEIGQTTFIATLSEKDAEDDWQPTDTRQVNLTADGRFLVFRSVGDLTPGSSGTGQQIYRYDAETGVLSRLSFGENGLSDNGNDGGSYGLEEHVYKVPGAAPAGSSISNDGATVVFAGSTALTPQALDHVCAREVGGGCAGEAENIYEWEQAGHGSCPVAEANGCVSLISDGQDTQSVLKTSAVTLIGVSGSGNDVFFTTADPLVGQDTDTQQDIYDARVNGGFPAPAVAAGCEGEACQGAPSTPPVFAAPGSAAFGGAGNLSAPAVIPAAKPKSKPKAKACKRGFVRKQSKCVKSKKANKAGHNGRGK